MLVHVLPNARHMVGIQIGQLGLPAGGQRLQTRHQHIHHAIGHGSSSGGAQPIDLVEQGVDQAEQHAPRAGVALHGGGGEQLGAAEQGMDPVAAEFQHDLFKAAATAQGIRPRAVVHAAVAGRHVGIAPVLRDDGLTLRLQAHDEAIIRRARDHARRAQNLLRARFHHRQLHARQAVRDDGAAEFVALHGVRLRLHIGRADHVVAVREPLLGLDTVGGQNEAHGNTRERVADRCERQ